MIPPKMITLRQYLDDPSITDDVKRRNASRLVWRHKTTNAMWVFHNAVHIHEKRVVVMVPYSSAGFENHHLLGPKNYPRTTAYKAPKWLIDVPGVEISESFIYLDDSTQDFLENPYAVTLDMFEADLSGLDAAPPYIGVYKENLNVIEEFIQQSKVHVATIKSLIADGKDYKEFGQIFYHRHYQFLRDVAEVLHFENPYTRMNPSIEVLISMLMLPKNAWKVWPNTMPALMRRASHLYNRISRFTDLYRYIWTYQYGWEE